jgi:hypothetical protein
MIVTIKVKKKVPAKINWPIEKKESNIKKCHTLLTILYFNCRFILLSRIEIRRFNYLVYFIQ